MDGLQGAIIIVDPNDLDEQALQELYDEEWVVFLQGWYNRLGPGIRTGMDQYLFLHIAHCIIVCFDTANLTPSCGSGLDSSPFIWLGNGQSFLINGKGCHV
jgi:FtsP/CotA-like multicopper oxidase with cupredoxin domain